MRRSGVEYTPRQSHGPTALRLGNWQGDPDLLAKLDAEIGKAATASIAKSRSAYERAWRYWIIFILVIAQLPATCIYRVYEDRPNLAERLADETDLMRFACWLAPPNVSTPALHACSWMLHVRMRLGGRVGSHANGRHRCVSRLDGAYDASRSDRHGLRGRVQDASTVTAPQGPRRALSLRGEGSTPGHDKHVREVAAGSMVVFGQVRTYRGSARNGIPGAAAGGRGGATHGGVLQHSEALDLGQGAFCAFSSAAQVRRDQDYTSQAGESARRETAAFTQKCAHRRTEDRTGTRRDYRSCYRIQLQRRSAHAEHCSSSGCADSGEGASLATMNQSSRIRTVGRSRTMSSCSGSGG